MTIPLTLRAEESAATRAGAPACCRLTRYERFKPARCRRSGLSAFRAGYGVCGFALLWLFAAVLPGRGAPVIDADIYVYGATSGGVVAAVAAARLGKNVVLVTYNNHVGGMSSGGLGVTDRGNISSIGGIAAEFYRRVGLA